MIANSKDSGSKYRSLLSRHYLGLASQYFGQGSWLTGAVDINTVTVYFLELSDPETDAIIMMAQFAFTTFSKLEKPRFCFPSKWTSLQQYFRREGTTLFYDTRWREMHYKTEDRVLDQKCDFGEDWSFIYYGKCPILILMKTPIVKPIGLKI